MANVFKDLSKTILFWLLSDGFTDHSLPLNLIFEGFNPTTDLLFSLIV